MYRIMKEVKTHFQNEYTQAFILQNWEDICIADLPKLSKISGCRGEIDHGWTNSR